MGGNVAGGIGLQNNNQMGSNNAPHQGNFGIPQGSPMNQVGVQQNQSNPYGNNYQGFQPYGNGFGGFNPNGNQSMPTQNTMQFNPQLFSTFNQMQQQQQQMPSPGVQNMPRLNLGQTAQMNEPMGGFTGQSSTNTTGFGAAPQADGLGGLGAIGFNPANKIGQ
jgi:hypothetical protein